MTPLLAILLLVYPAATANPQAASTPRLRVESDGFPGGHGTPEGAACDLARAFIRHDAQLFRSTCLSPYGPAAYREFLDNVVESMRQEAAKPSPSPDGPRAIGKVFAARHLSRNGPASYGYTVLGVQDVMFVDIGVTLHNGSRALNRTLVVQNREGAWYVHPAPDISPLLSVGLNEESPSEKDFSSVYDIGK